MFRCPLLFIFLLVAIQPHAGAQSNPSSEINPESVLISRFNFVRPQGWKWIDTRSKQRGIQQSVIFRVNASANEDEDCYVYIHHFEPNRPSGTRTASLSRWKEALGNTSDTVTFDKPVLVGTNKIFYVDVTGTQRAESQQKKNAVDRPNMMQSGAVVEDPQGNLVLRLNGPIELVKAAKPAFRKMIEDALKEE